nr:hypothetical protein [Tanacetum cinerariifolium]
DCAIVNHQLSVTVCGGNILKWFNNRRVSDKIPLNLPQTRFTEMIGLAMCCRLHPAADKDNAIGGTYLRIIFESTKLCGGFNSEDFAITFSSWQDIPQCGVHVISMYAILLGQCMDLHVCRQNKEAVEPIGISDLYEMIGLAMCCRLHLPADKGNAIGDTYLRIIFESTKLCGGFNSEDLALTFSSWQDIPQCGVHVVYKNDIKLVTRTESWIPDHMEYGWTDHDGIFRDDLQHGKWSKPSFLCDTEDANVKYVRL